MTLGVLDRHRHDLTGEEAVLGVLVGALVAAHGVLVHLGAADAELVGEDLRHLELRHQLTVACVQEGGTERTGAARSVRRHRRTRHRLDPARDGEVVTAGDHALRREVHGLLGRAALPVDAGGRDALRQPGRDPRVAGDVAPLLAYLGDAAADHVVDPLGIHLGTIQQLLQRERQQVGGVPAGQRALAFADRRADGVDDHGFSRHGARVSVPTGLPDTSVR